VAGRARRRGDVAEVSEDRGAHATHERDVERVGKAPLRVTVQDDAAAEALAEPTPEAVAERAHALGGRGVARGDAARLAEPDREERALGAGAPSVLVPGAVDEGLEPDTATHVERADPLRRAELVARDREQVDAELRDAHRDLPHRLRRIAVEECARLVRDVRARRDRLDRADLVVRVHHAHEHRARRERAPQRLRIHEPGPVHR